MVPTPQQGLDHTNQEYAALEGLDHEVEIDTLSEVCNVVCDVVSITTDNRAYTAGKRHNIAKGCLNKAPRDFVVTSTTINIRIYLLRAMSHHTTADSDMSRITTNTHIGQLTMLLLSVPQYRRMHQGGACRHLTTSV